MVVERPEWVARLTLLLILLGLPLVIFGFQFVLRPTLSDARIVDIHMVMPEYGGFSEDVIEAHTGETITLRFHADDVTHGIAIGPGLDIDLGAIDPGKVGEVTLTLDRPGTYTYYCTTWCSTDHWRMRGVLQVRDITQPDVIPTAQTDSVIANLQVEGINIDAPRTLFQPVWGLSFVAPENLEGWTIPQELNDSEWRQTHTPVEASELLAAENPEQPFETVYAVAASFWLSNPISTAIDGQYLYNQNCAACHGETGLSDGPNAFNTAVQPPAFGNESYMFAMRSDVLYAKIRRGGMGTDMPNFGTLLTPAETWALVDYLWQLAF
jgi:mono/diheme cytochrome c family protein/plastocyanin